ncbi:MAG: EAL domain-containing protein, partial [Sterolibacterium sp.]
RRLVEATRAGDTLARLGDDEFVLLLEDDVVAQQVVVARKLLELFTAPLLIAGHELALTASIGISVYPADGTDADTLLKHADQAMHNAKAEGRNTYRFFDPALSAGLLERLLMEKALRSALAKDQLLLHYQPQVDSYSGEVTGLEALLRWQHSDLGLLLPGEFLSLAEETDLIVPIGAWVLQAACRQLHAWHAAGHAGLRVAINVSALQFASGALMEPLMQALRDSGLDGRYVELELNESSVALDIAKTQAMLRQIKALGVGLAINNFDLGNSKLGYLKYFPIDQLKIDKSFIRGIAANLYDASIVQAIIAMGHGLGMKMIAEGVETEAQAGYLRTLHCDEMQGFHFSRALPADEIPALLAARTSFVTRPEAGGGRVLLLVDDEANILSALKRLLRRDGYQILTAASAEEGMEALARHQVGVVLSDQRMPGMSGTEFLSQVKVMYPHIVRMILSGYTDVNSITESINRGEVYKFLTKPWEDEPLREALKEAFMHYETSRDGSGAG